MKTGCSLFTGSIGDIIITHFSHSAQLIFAISIKNPMLIGKIRLDRKELKIYNRIAVLCNSL